MSEKFLRLPKVIEITARAKPTIYADIRKGMFPSPIKIGPRASAWLESDVRRWMSERVAAMAAKP